jgi:hypothetical protein
MPKKEGKRIKGGKKGEETDRNENYKSYEYQT